MRFLVIFETKLCRIWNSSQFGKNNVVFILSANKML